MEPSKGTALKEIMRIVFVGECLAFEGDVAIGSDSVETVLDKAQKVLKHIEEIENWVGEFPLLIGVDSLVGDFVRQELAPSALDEDGAKEVDSVEITWGKVFCVDDAHGR